MPCALTRNHTSDLPLRATMPNQLSPTGQGRTPLPLLLPPPPERCRHRELVASWAGLIPSQTTEKTVVPHVEPKPTSYYTHALGLPSAQRVLRERSNPSSTYLQVLEMPVTPPPPWSHPGKAWPLPFLPPLLTSHGFKSPHDPDLI